MLGPGIGRMVGVIDGGYDMFDPGIMLADRVQSEVNEALALELERRNIPINFGPDEFRCIATAPDLIEYYWRDECLVQVAMNHKKRRFEVRTNDERERERKRERRITR